MVISKYQYAQCPGSIYVFMSRVILPVQSIILWSVHSPKGIPSCGKGGQTNGSTKGYKNPTVPRQLFGRSQIPQNLSPAYPHIGSLCQELGWIVNIENHGQTGIQLLRLTV